MQGGINGRLFYNLLVNIKKGFNLNPKNQLLAMVDISNIIYYLLSLFLSSFSFIQLYSPIMAMIR